MHESKRLTAVQTPVIPIVSQWMAETPGTISLGQGMVAYGPPDAAIVAAREFPKRDHAARRHRARGGVSLPKIASAAGPRGTA